MHRSSVKLNEALRAENSRLKNELSTAGSGVFRRNHDDANPRVEFRRNLDKKAALRDLWKKYQKMSMAQDKNAGQSQAQRYCDAVSLYANVRDSPMVSDDPLCDAMDAVDERNQKRVLNGLLLWAQHGRCS